MRSDDSAFEIRDPYGYLPDASREALCRFFEAARASDNGPPVGLTVIVTIGEDDHWSSVPDAVSTGPTIVLVEGLTPERAKRALVMGAVSIGSYDAPPENHVSLVVSVAHHEVCLPVELVRLLAIGSSLEPPLLPPELAAEEVAWLRQLSLGRSVTDVAVGAFLSRRSMYRRLQSVYARLGASNRHQAVSEAVRLGLFD